MGDEAFKSNPVGTGPFMFSSFKPMERIVLLRHPKFFRGPAKLAGVELYYMPEREQPGIRSPEG